MYKIFQALFATRQEGTICNFKPETFNFFDMFIIDQK